MAQRRVDVSTVSIRPGVRVLSVLRHLNYKPWFALAEFVDNAVQSYLEARSKLKRLDGPKAQLRVDIVLDASAGGRIAIRDNAAGIHRREFPRAFRAAEVPPDSTGLSEFGMGMKSAACWFAPRWSVRTKALDQDFEDTVSLDIDQIVKDSLDELEIQSRPVARKKHYTELLLHRPYNGVPQRKTLGKVKTHLASIYRVFLREKLLILSINGEPLAFEEPKVLVAPYFRESGGRAIRWEKQIDIKLDGSRRVHGVAALRETASTSDAGFALFRRRRLIQGSGDEGYRPEQIFGQSNTYTYQRLFGELHFEGFSVTHTKDGFRWGGLEESFLAELKRTLNARPIALLSQANGYRARLAKKSLTPAAEQAVERTAALLAANGGRVIARLATAAPVGGSGDLLPTTQAVARRAFELRYQGTKWRIDLEFTNDPSVGEWLTVGDVQAERGRGGSDRTLALRIALDHPFTLAFAGARNEGLEPLLRIGAAVGLAEITARESGARQAGTVRRNMNDILRTTLSTL